MRVVRRAVERVDDPALVALAAMRGAFFTQDRAARERSAQARRDQRLARAIRRRYEIAALRLLADVEGRSPVLEQQGTGFTRQVARER